MVSIEEIIAFLREISGSKKIYSDSDLYNDIGIVGDDFHEMIESFSTRFSVEMKKYLWYFHTDEEVALNNFGALFFRPPYKRVERIPITPDMLCNFANTGIWIINYPEHKIPNKRYDLLINKFFIIAVGILIFVILFTS